MAQRGTPLDVATIRRIQRCRATNGIKATARLLGLARNTVRKYSRPRGG